MAAVKGIDIIRAAHVEFLVTDLERSRNWYVDLLGFNVTQEEPGVLYLRGAEERCHHSLVLRQAQEAAVSHISFRVAGEQDLEALEQLCETQGLPCRRVAPGEEAGQGAALRMQDPNGIPLEFYAEMDWVDSLMQAFHLHRGPGVQRLDHINCGVSNVQQAYDWYTENLGFRCSEYTITDEASAKLWAAWLHRKPNVHDLAVMNCRGPQLHHVGFWVENPLCLLKACDILAAAGWSHSIERGPGRHGLSNAMFLYLRDPDGHRVELYTGDYLTADPDLPPIRWLVTDKQRQTFWGHAAPVSWFEELSPFLDIRTGQKVPASEPLLAERPQTAIY